MSEYTIRYPGSASTPSPLLADDIDPETRDFKDLTVGADPIDAQVQLAMQIVRGSGASVQEDGLSQPPLKMDEASKSYFQSEVRFALKRLVDNGDIRLHSVEFDYFEPGTQTSEIRVVYENLRSQAQNRVRDTRFPMP